MKTAAESLKTGRVLKNKGNTRYQAGCGVIQPKIQAAKPTFYPIFVLKFRGLGIDFCRRSKSFLIPGIYSVFPRRLWL